MLDWVIIGGGIQGCTLGTYLLRCKKTKIENMAIIDPHEHPLSAWRHCTSILEMPYLRSPSIHHIDVDPFALEKFAQSPNAKYLGGFHLPYDRPALDLFNHHCLHVFEETQLQKCWIQGRAAGLQRIESGWKVNLADGKQIKSKHVALAMGLSEHPFYPEWAKTVQLSGGNIAHVFDKNTPDFNNLPCPITVIGGGISAAHISLRLSRLYPGGLTLVTRHTLRVHQFDSDPGWLGPKHMSSYLLIHDYNDRRRVIQKARYRGSMPAELHKMLFKAQQQGTLTIQIDEVNSASVTEGGTIFHLESGNEIVSSSTILATGFHSRVPGIEWLESTIRDEGLHCADCGYPIVSPKTLEWGPNLFVIGALAELEIGPVSRNIAGARRGAERIVQAT